VKNIQARQREKERERERERERKRERERVRVSERGKSDYDFLNNEPWTERFVPRHCPIIFQLKDWIFINPPAAVASINSTPYQVTTVVGPMWSLRSEVALTTFD